MCGINEDQTKAVILSHHNFRPRSDTQAILEALDRTCCPEKIAAYASGYSWHETARALFEEFRQAAGLQREAGVGSHATLTCPPGGVA